MLVRVLKQEHICYNLIDKGLIKAFAENGGCRRRMVPHAGWSGEEEAK